MSLKDRLDRLASSLNVAEQLLVIVSEQYHPLSPEQVVAGRLNGQWVLSPYYVCLILGPHSEAEQRQVVKRLKKDPKYQRPSRPASVSGAPVPSPQSPSLSPRVPAEFPGLGAGSGSMASDPPARATTTFNPLNIERSKP